MPFLRVLPSCFLLIIFMTYPAVTAENKPASANLDSMSPRPGTHATETGSGTLGPATGPGTLGPGTGPRTHETATGAQTGVVTNGGVRTGITPCDTVSSGMSGGGETITSEKSDGMTNPRAKKHFFTSEFECQSDKFSSILSNFWSNPIQIIAAAPVILLILITTAWGFLYLIGAIFSSSAENSNLSYPVEQGDQKGRPGWLQALEENIDELKKEAISIQRRIRILFGFGLIAFGGAATLLIYFIYATINKEISNTTHVISFMAPIITFQLIAVFLIKQTASAQKELTFFKIEISRNRQNAASGIAASGNEEAFSKFVEGLHRENTEGKKAEKKEDGNVQITQRDLRALANLFSIFSRT